MYSLILFIFPLFLGIVDGTGCFHCVSPDPSLSAIVQSQLKNQKDTFFYPVEARSSGCSSSISEEISPNIELQLCSRMPFCVTIAPNVPNTTFVIRGCLENSLRLNLRENTQLQTPGCYLVRSHPSIPLHSTLDYIICVCEGNQCNSQSPSEYLSIETTRERKNVEKLLVDENGFLSLSESSSTSTASSSILFIWFLSLLISCSFQ